MPSCYWWRSWLRHCATNRQVAGSIPDGVIEIFLLHNPSGRTMVDSSSNRNEYQEYFLGGKGGRCVGLTTLPPSRAVWSTNLGASTSCSPIGLPRPLMGCFTLPLPYFVLVFMSKHSVS